MKIIKDLKIRDGSYNFLDNDNEKLLELSKVNIFVGENNSGKSRFLRSIFYDNNAPLEFIPEESNYNDYLSKISKIKNILKNQKMRKQILRQYKLPYKDIESYLKINEYVTESQSSFEKLTELYATNKSKYPANRALIQFFNEYFENEDFSNGELFKYDFYKIYIPSLRGLLPLIPDKTISTNYVQQKHINEFISEDVFGQRTKNDYFGEDANILFDVTDSLMKHVQNTNNYIITGHYFYKYVQEFLLGNLQQRKIIKEYQEYLSKNFFQNQDVTLIPKLEDEVLTVKIGDEEEQKIYNLGEGIQSIILITLPLFLYLEKSEEENTNILVFIEEPEVGLHPHLQRELLKTLLSPRFENYQFFFTTHSNHFIDQTFNDEHISIYSFDKDINNQKTSIPKFSIEKVGFDHLPTLKKLGALPSSVLGSNCTILVEGSYDVIHYDFYLDLYQKKLKNENPNITIFKKGVNYSFLRGGGKEIIKTVEDFNSIQKERIFTVLDFDSETESEKNKELFDGIYYKNYKILDVMEVENLISKDVLIKILNSFREIRRLGITEDFDEKDYQKTNFHTFIKNEIITGEIPENFFNEDTFKFRFSFKEKEFTENYDELSDAAKEVTETLYEFIKKNNN